MYPGISDIVRQEIFFDYLDHIYEGIVVELGTLIGVNLCIIAERYRYTNIQFYGIDNLTFQYDEITQQYTSCGSCCGQPNLKSYNQFYETVAKHRLYGIVKLLVGRSTEWIVDAFPDESISLVFLDTDHTYDHVLLESEMWWKKIKIGGILAGHDWNFKGVKEAICSNFTKINVTSDSTGFWIKK